MKKARIKRGREKNGAKKNDLKPKGGNRRGGEGACNNRFILEEAAYCSWGSIHIGGSTGTVYTASAHNTHYPSRCNHTIGWLSEPGLSRTSALCSRRFDSSEEK